MRTYSWKPFLQPGTTLLANLFLEKLIGNLVLWAAEDPKLTLLGKTFPSKFPGRGPKQVSRKRFPSKVKFLGTACKYGSQKTVPKQGPRNRFPARFQARTRLAGTGSQTSVPRKSWFASKISRSNWEPLLANLFLGTLLENLFLETLLETLFLGTLLGNLFLETLPGNFFREPYL